MALQMSYKLKKIVRLKVINDIKDHTNIYTLAA